MIVKTNGIVLSHIKYGDSSIIVKIYTEELGFGSFIVNSIRKMNSKKSIGHFLSFSLLELVLYVKESRSLQRVSDFKSLYPLYHLHQDYIKASITIFLSEALTGLLRSESSASRHLYNFMIESIVIFDKLKEGVENFHLQFLMKLAAYLGFAIEEFETLFTSLDRLVPHKGDDHAWETLIHEPYGCSVKLNGNVRCQIIDTLMSYYHHHTNLAKPKSLEVLKKVLH